MASLDLRFVADPPARHTVDDALPADDPLLCFNEESHTEAEISHSAVSAGRRRPRRVLVAMLGTALILLAMAVVRSRFDTAAAATAPVKTGMVDITSQPPGAAVTIDGQPRGVTPLRLSLDTGPHLAELISGGTSSSLPLIVDSGAALRQHITFASGPAGNAADEVVAETSSLANGPASGPRSDVGGTVARLITVPDGAAIVAAVDRPVAVPAMGWVRLTAPIAVHAAEGTRLIEPTASGRLRLSPGRHELEITNAAFDFRATLQLNVEPGRTMTVPIAVPNGRLSINAIPWADVSVDARPVGVTPLGNLSLPIGLHEVVWRHPQFGERRQTVILTERSPVGLGMDLTN